MSKLFVVSVMLAMLVTVASASAQNYWGQPRAPLPNPAPQIPVYGQQQPNPLLQPNFGMRQPQLPPNYLQPPQPPQSSVNIFDMNNGSITHCVRNGAIVQCF